jgi:hypothetical protein
VLDLILFKTSLSKVINHLSDLLAKGSKVAHTSNEYCLSFNSFRYGCICQLSSILFVDKIIAGNFVIPLFFTYSEIHSSLKSFSINLELVKNGTNFS